MSAVLLGFAARRQPTELWRATSFAHLVGTATVRELEGAHRMYCSRAIEMPTDAFWAQLPLSSRRRPLRSDHRRASSRLALKASLLCRP